MGYWLIRRKSWILRLVTFYVSLMLTFVVKSFFTVTVVEITSLNQVEKRLAIGFPLYQAADMQEVQMRRSATMFINSSNVDLYLFPIEYYTYKPGKEEYITAPLPMHSHIFFNHDIDYYPSQIPPQTITLNSSASQVKYWLTTEEQYLEMYPEAKEYFEN